MTDDQRDEYGIREDEPLTLGDLIEIWACAAVAVFLLYIGVQVFVHLTFPWVAS